MFNSKKKTEQLLLERESHLRDSLGLVKKRRPDVVYSITKEKSLFSLSNIVLLTLVCLWLLINSFFSFSIVSGHSMDSTLHDREIVLFKRTQKVRRFDIVSLKERTENGAQAKHIVKRVIGLPGDIVTVIHGQLYINEQLVDEGYLDDENITDFKKSSFTIKVPEGRIFVLGDNRDVSKDSRAVGCFELQSIVGVKSFSLF